MSTSIKPLSSDIFKLIKDEFEIAPVFIEKDWYTQYILGVISRFESDEFQPIFSGGTCLSKGYRLIERFSEDIDFRMRPLKEKLTRSYRSNYQDRFVEAILASSSDLQLVRDVYKRDRSTFLKCQLANLIKSPGELLSKLIEKLTSNKLYQSHYQDFVETVAYGESPTFQAAVAALNSLTSKIQGEFSI